MKKLFNCSPEKGIELVVQEAGKARRYSLDSGEKWLLGRETPESKPDIPLKSEIAGRRHGEFLLDPSCFDTVACLYDGSGMWVLQFHTPYEARMAEQRLANMGIASQPDPKLHLQSLHGLAFNANRYISGSRCPNHFLAPERPKTV